ncbi:MAG TPA: ComF family protein [Thermomicrobiaceae bacterium]|nr:ComF family protein [Thermomicrobiaceae bacterium]
MRAGFRFSGPIRQSIHYFKYGGEYARGPVLGAMLAEQVVDHWRLLPMPDLIVPIPLFSRRQRQRGYNQSEILALAVGETFDVAVTNSLTRQFDTPPQVGLDASSRRQNVDGVFKCNAPAGELEDLHVLLVDDVITTGSTMLSAARAVLDAGALEVSCLALARQLSRDR